MKKSLVVKITMFMMMVPMFFATGCAKESKRGGMDWYSEIPRAEHELRFPQGHEKIPPGKINCVYDEKRKIYLCQFE